MHMFGMRRRSNEAVFWRRPSTKLLRMSVHCARSTVAPLSAAKNSRSIEAANIRFILMTNCELRVLTEIVENKADSLDLVGDCGDTVDLNIEMSGPRGHVDEDSCRGILGKVAGVNGIDDRELLHRGAVDVALEHVF